MLAHLPTSMLRLLAAIGALVVAGVRATHGDVYSVAFRRQLTPAFVARIETAVGYECTETKPGNALVLFLNASSMAALERDVGHVVASIVAMPPVMRLSTSLVAVNVSAGDAHTRRSRAYLTRSLETLTAVPPPETIALRVMVHAGALTEAAATYWRGMVAATPGVPRVESVTSTYLRVANVSVATAYAVALAVAQHVPSVCFIEPELPVVLANMWSASTIQVPAAISATNRDVADTCSVSTCHPLWAAGLRGAGQLLAISDTGVATGSCFFVDPSRAVPISTSFSTVPPDTGHRTIRVIWTGSGGDTVDVDGHGTHVAGIALGRPTPGTSDVPTAFDATDFTGTAPEARLVLVDVQQGTGGLSIPAPYDSALLQYVYNAGARVHSGSWGIASSRYTDEDRRVDAFCWSHRTFVAVFAAGNVGAPGTVLTPALAKNALAVGAAMNGFTAFDIAAGSTPAFPADTYAFDWIADFSSRGGAAMPVTWAKPNLVAGGGQYVWSADVDGTACTAPIGSLVSGLAGTSMATPNVAAAALLVRQYFMEGFYGTAVFEPMGALVRALLVASTTSTRGVFPNVAMSSLAASSTYAPYGRQYIEGHGRAAVARVLPLASTDGTLIVLDNERASFTAPGQVHRYCVVISGGTSEFVVALAYTDYPASVGSGVAALVNDIDVRVYVDDATTPLAPNGLTTRDSRSPIEVVRGTTTHGRLRIEIEAFALGFSVQSVAAALVVFEPNRVVLVNGDSVGAADAVDFDTTPGSSCVVCSERYVPTSECGTCGDGIVTAPVESCDPAALMSPCCADCAIIADNRACQYPLIDADCYFVGTCSNAATAMCTIDYEAIANQTFVRDPGTGACVAVTAPTPAPTAASPPPPVVCAQSVDAALRGLALATPTDVICCMSHTHIADAYVSGESGPLDPVFARLARHVVAATENIRRGVSVSAFLLLRVAEARALLDAHCSTGFTTVTRRDAHALLTDVALVNTGTCVGDVRGDTHATATCVSEQVRADTHYCSAHGTYDAVNDACECTANFFGARCDARHCAAHGTSAPSASRCVCDAGWRGDACTQCSLSPLAGHTYWCVALDRNTVPTELAQYSRVLSLVVTSSLTARRDGTYYASEALRTASDVAPGTEGVDCACQEPATQLDYRAFTSADAQLAAREAFERDQHALRSLAIPGSRPPAPPPRSSAPRHVSVSLGMLVVLVVVVGIESA